MKNSLYPIALMLFACSWYGSFAQSSLLKNETVTQCIDTLLLTANYRDSLVLLDAPDFGWVEAFQDSSYIYESANGTTCRDSLVFEVCDFAPSLVCDTVAIAIFKDLENCNCPVGLLGSLSTCSNDFQFSQKTFDTVFLLDSTRYGNVELDSNAFSYDLLEPPSSADFFAIRACQLNQEMIPVCQDFEVRLELGDANCCFYNGPISINNNVDLNDTLRNCKDTFALPLINPGTIILANDSQYGTVDFFDNQYSYSLRGTGNCSDEFSAFICDTLSAGIFCDRYNIGLAMELDPCFCLFEEEVAVDSVHDLTFSVAACAENFSIPWLKQDTLVMVHPTLFGTVEFQPSSNSFDYLLEGAPFCEDSLHFFLCDTVGSSICDAYNITLELGNDPCFCIDEEEIVVDSTVRRVIELDQCRDAFFELPAPDTLIPVIAPTLGIAFFDTQNEYLEYVYTGPPTAGSDSLVYYSCDSLANSFLCTEVKYVFNIVDGLSNCPDDKKASSWLYQRKCVNVKIDCGRMGGVIALSQFILSPGNKQQQGAFSIIRPPAYGTACFTSPDTIFYSNSSPTVTMDSLDILHNDNGVKKIYKVNLEIEDPNCCGCGSVPSLSEWGIILLLLSLSTLGIIGIKGLGSRSALSLVLLNNIKATLRFWLSTWLGILLLVFLFYGELLLQDCILSTIAAALITIAYRVAEAQNPTQF